MAGEFHRLQIKRYPKIERKQTSDTKYWKKYRSPIIAKEYGAVSFVHFSPVKPHDFAVTSASRVQIYSSTTNQVIKSISRFRELAYSGCYRNDGQLLVAGGQDGLIQLFDLSSRAVLRKFKGHNEAVRVTRFLQNNQNLVSAADDKVVKCWDISTEQEVVSFMEHKDYIRTGVVNNTNTDIFLTGSYDHTVHMWDRRCEKSVMTLDHGSPVECIQLYPNGGMCLSAGNNFIKVWDLLAGGRLVTEFSNHQKTVTTLCFDGEHKRLLSGSIDKHVKIYDLQDYKIVHSMKYPSPILSMAVSPDDSHLVVGMSDGLLSIKYRQTHNVEETSKTRETSRPGNYKYFLRGRRYTPQESDVVVSEEKKRHLGKYDKLLKNFEYSAALDAILQPLANHPPVVVSLIQELNRRGGLKGALAGKDEKGLVPILFFLIRNINNPRFSVVLTDVANIVLDMYLPIFGQSAKIDGLFFQLRTCINNELAFSKQAFELLGAMDTLFAAASVSNQSTS